MRTKAAVTPDKRSAWLKKLDEECPQQVVLPRRQLMARQRDHGPPPEARRRVRHVRSRRVGRVRALLLPGPDGRRDLPVALRAESRAAQARRLTSDDPFREETDDPLVADRRNFFHGRAVDQGRPARRALAVRWQQPRQCPRAVRCLRQVAAARARLTIRQRSRVVAEWP